MLLSNATHGCLSVPGNVSVSLPMVCVKTEYGPGSWDIAGDANSATTATSSILWAGNINIIIGGWHTAVDNMRTHNPVLVTVSFVKSVNKSQQFLVEPLTCSRVVDFSRGYM